MNLARICILDSAFHKIELATHAIWTESIIANLEMIIAKSRKVTQNVAKSQKYVYPTTTSTGCICWFEYCNWTFRHCSSAIGGMYAFSFFTAFSTTGKDFTFFIATCPLAWTAICSVFQLARTFFMIWGMTTLVCYAIVTTITFFPTFDYSIPANCR